MNLFASPAHLTIDRDTAYFGGQRIGSLVQQYATRLLKDFLERRQIKVRQLQDHLPEVEDLYRQAYEAHWHAIMADCVAHGWRVESMGRAGWRIR